MPSANPTRYTIPSASRALADLLAQHKTIRSLLRESIAIADRIAHAGDPDALAALRAHLPIVRDTVNEHLIFEQKLLLPLLEDDLPLGPLRARKLAEEHARQRDELAELAAFEGTPVAFELAGRTRRLAQEFLVDMDEEERVLLVPEVVRDDMINVDQTDG